MPWKTTAIAPAPPGMTATLGMEIDGSYSDFPVVAMLLQTRTWFGDEETRVQAGILNPDTGEIQGVDTTSLGQLVIVNTSTVVS